MRNNFIQITVFCLSKPPVGALFTGMRERSKIASKYLINAVVEDWKHCFYQLGWSCNMACIKNVNNHQVIKEIEDKQRINNDEFIYIAL